MRQAPRIPQLAANDNWRAVYALIDDLKFSNLYHVVFTVVAKVPHNIDGKAFRVWRDFSASTGNHVLPVITGGELPYDSPHRHFCLSTEKPIKRTVLRNKATKQGFSVDIDDWEKDRHTQYILGGKTQDNVHIGHIQQPPYSRVFCPNPKNCESYEGVKLCAHVPNLPFKGKLTPLYRKTRVYRALIDGQRTVLLPIIQKAA